MFNMTYQPTILDSPVSTYWDLAQFNVVIQNGIVQSGLMTFNCYSSSQNVGNPQKVLSQHSFPITAADVAAFQKANNLAPGQIAQLAYGLAKAILDTDSGQVDKYGNSIMQSFFNGATTV